MIEKQLLTAVIVPVGILVVTVVCKCLIRMSWPRLTDFYMGIDAMMAAIASGLIYLCDLGYQYRDAKKTVDPKDRAAPAGSHCKARLLRDRILCCRCGFSVLFVAFSPALRSPKIAGENA